MPYPSRPVASLFPISQVYQPYFLPKIVHPALKDPRSLEHIRDGYKDAGYRAIGVLEQEIAQGYLPLEKEVRSRFIIASLYLYEGDFAKAAATLERTRSLAEQSSVAS